jgi:hypothetical protein
MWADWDAVGLRPVIGVAQKNWSYFRMNIPLCWLRFDFNARDWSAREVESLDLQLASRVTQRAVVILRFFLAAGLGLCNCVSWDFCDPVPSENTPFSWVNT